MKIKLKITSFLVLSALTSTTAMADITIPGILEIQGDNIKIPGVVEVEGNNVNVSGVVEIEGDNIKIPGVVEVHSSKSVSTQSVKIDKKSSTKSIVVNLNGKRRFFKDKDMSRSDFSNQDFSNVTFDHVDASRANFSGANFSGAIFIDSDFSRVDFSGATLAYTKFQNVELNRANMSNTCFPYANVIDSDLSRVKLSNAILIETTFSNSEMYRVSKEGAVYKGTPKCVTLTKDVKVESHNVNQRATFIKSENITKKLVEKKSVDLTINFEFDSDKIDGEAHRQIFEIAKALKSKALSKSRIEIQGHTDNLGKAKYNKNLSYKRAMSVMKELSSKYDIDSDLFDTNGFGESQPIASNLSDEGRALNRRVTLVRLD